MPGGRPVIRALRYRCLSVLTLADAERFRTERSYADRDAERVLDYHLNLDDCRGAGRLHILDRSREF